MLSWRKAQSHTVVGKSGKVQGKKSLERKVTNRREDPGKDSDQSKEMHPSQQLSWSHLTFTGVFVLFQQEWLAECRQEESKILKSFLVSSFLGEGTGKEAEQLK